MMPSFLATAAIMAMLLSVPLETLAQHHGWGWYEGRPYGDYCPGSRWGGPYGMRKAVATTDEAKQVIERYYAVRQKTIIVGRIAERRWFFLAEILDQDGKVIDETIIDKRTGRIRSIY
jgi:hypothetical protein